MFGADVVLAWMCLNRLNDAKKQYLYKAVADRLSPRGLFVIADRLEPQQLLHHLDLAEARRLSDRRLLLAARRQAVFGGFQAGAASERRPPADSSPGPERRPFPPRGSRTSSSDPAAQAGDHRKLLRGDGADDRQHDLSAVRVA